MKPSVVHRKAPVSVGQIESRIWLVHGCKVLLDRDLAALYGVETRVLNQAVRRNLDRFPADFMFALTREDIHRISQIVTSSDIRFSKSVLAFNGRGSPCCRVCSTALAPSR